MGKSSIQMGFGCSRKKIEEINWQNTGFFSWVQRGFGLILWCLDSQCNVYHHKGFRVSISWAAPQHLDTRLFTAKYFGFMDVQSCSISSIPKISKNPRVLDGFRPIPIQILQSPHPNPTLATSAFQTHVCSLCGAVFADVSAPWGHENPGGDG